MLPAKLWTPAVVIAALAAAATLVAACSSSGEATGSTCPTDSTLTYETFGRSFFDANCAKCHGASGNESPRLDTVAAIRANAAAIDRTSAAGPNATNTEMPEDGSVSDADRKKLGEWLACGAP